MEEKKKRTLDHEQKRQRVALVDCCNKEARNCRAEQSQELASRKEKKGEKDLRGASWPTAGVRSLACSVMWVPGDNQPISDCYAALMKNRDLSEGEEYQE